MHSARTLAKTDENNVISAETECNMEEYNRFYWIFTGNTEKSMIFEKFLQNT